MNDELNRAPEKEEEENNDKNISQIDQFRQNEEEEQELQNEEIIENFADNNKTDEISQYEQYKKNELIEVLEKSENTAPMNPNDNLDFNQNERFYESNNENTYEQNLRLNQNQTGEDNFILNKTLFLLSKHSSTEELKRQYKNKYLNGDTQYNFSNSTIPEKNEYLNTQRMDYKTFMKRSLADSKSKSKSKEKPKEKTVLDRKAIAQNIKEVREQNLKKVFRKKEDLKYKYNIHFNYSDKETMDKLKEQKIVKNIRYPHYNYTPNGTKDNLIFTLNRYENNYEDFNFDVTPYYEGLMEDSSKTNSNNGHVELFLRKGENNTFHDRPYCFREILEGNTLFENYFGKDDYISKYKPCEDKYYDYG
ncbi:MAG: hypothetical protein MJ252_17765, partial [archaeon]|nr:hypothetical protein [archaeon]